MRKREKKLFSLLLAVTMCVSTAASVGAIEAGEMQEVANAGSAVEEVSAEAEFIAEEAAEEPVENSGVAEEPVETAGAEEVWEEIPTENLESGEEFAEEVEVEEVWEEASAEETSTEEQEPGEQLIEGGEAEELSVEEELLDADSAESAEIETLGAAVTSGDYEYELNADGKTVTITKYNGNGGDVTIPAKLDGHAVTVIGKKAFYNCDSLTGVTIPQGVITIGNYAFGSCSKLTSASISNGVTSIGYGAFESCYKLTSVTIPNSVTDIGEYAFQSCNKLASVILPNGITEIKEGTFHGCDLTSIRIPNSVTTIGSRAFEYSDLTSVTIPNSVTSIGWYAFDHCSDLTSVIIPASVTSIGRDAFYYTPWLKAQGDFVIINGILYLYQGTDANVTIPDSATSIGPWAFEGCTSLISVSIPDVVKSIGENAFSGCKNLAGVSIGNGVTSIGSSAFSGCQNLSSVTMGNSVTSIGSSAFATCTSLTSVSISDSVTSIGNCAFIECTDLTSVIIGNNVKTIGQEAFKECTSLTSVSIPASVKSIGRLAFHDCTGMKSATVLSKTVEMENCRLGMKTGLVTSEKGSYMGAVKISGFVLNGYSGSTAQTYATENGITFKALDTPSSSAGLSAPVISSLSNTTKGITIKWGAVSGAAKYRVFYKGGSVKSWTKLGDTTATSYTFKKAVSGTTYSFTVRCLSSDGKSYTSSYDAAGKSIRYLSAGKISSLTNTSSGITVKWSRVTGASGYYLYRKTSGGSYSKIRTIASGSTVSYSDTAVKSGNGTTYTYAVRPYYGKTMGAYTGKSTVRLTGVSISSVNNVKEKKITVKWAKDSKVSGYQIQYSTNAAFSSSKIVNVKKKSSTSATITGLTKKKTYYVRIRTYKTVSGKNYYSGWSSKKSITIKK